MHEDCYKSPECLSILRVECGGFGTSLKEKGFRCPICGRLMKKGMIFPKPDLPLRGTALATSLFWADANENGSMTGDIKRLAGIRESLRSYRCIECGIIVSRFKTEEEKNMGHWWSEIDFSLRRER